MGHVHVHSRHEDNVLPLKVQQQRAPNMFIQYFRFIFPLKNDEIFLLKLPVLFHVQPSDE